MLLLQAIPAPPQPTLSPWLNPENPSLPENQINKQKDSFQNRLALIQATHQGLPQFKRSETVPAHAICGGDEARDRFLGQGIAAPGQAKSYGSPGARQLRPPLRRRAAPARTREASPRFHPRGKAVLGPGRRSSPRRCGDGDSTARPVPEAPRPLPPRSPTHVLSVTPSCSAFSASPPAEGSRRLPPARAWGSPGNLFLRAAVTSPEKKRESRCRARRGRCSTAKHRFLAGPRSPARAPLPRGRRAAGAALPSIPAEVGAGGSPARLLLRHLRTGRRRPSRKLKPPGAAGIFHAPNTPKNHEKERGERSFPASARAGSLGAGAEPAPLPQPPSSGLETKNLEIKAQFGDKSRI